MPSRTDGGCTCGTRLYHGQSQRVLDRKCPEHGAGLLSREREGGAQSSADMTRCYYSVVRGELSFRPPRGLRVVEVSDPVADAARQCPHPPADAVVGLDCETGDRLYTPACAGHLALAAAAREP